MVSPSPASPARSILIQRERALVVDRRNMTILWLEEKVARHEISNAEAHKMLDEQENKGKFWGGPLKDAGGGANLFMKLARDFASWKGAKVEFMKSSAGHDLVVFRGWSAGRKIITGTRYRVDNPKIIEMQIGKPGLRAAGRESARFGLMLVVAVDVADWLLNDKRTLGGLFGKLTVDIPSVMLASAIGTAAGAAMTSTAATGLAAFVGSFALGPLAVAFIVGLGVAFALAWADEKFGISAKLGELYDDGIAKLKKALSHLGEQAEQRYDELANSHFVHNLRQNSDVLAHKLARQLDWIHAEMAHVW